MKNFSVLSWNIQGQPNFTGYTFFKKVKPHLLRSSADIIVLQEASDRKKFANNKEISKTYQMFAPERYNNNILLSKFPIVAADEIVFPKWGQKRTLENCLRADIQIDSQILRVYNCHFAIFKAGIQIRLKQLEYILADAKTHDGPVIICGDLNTTIPKAGFRRMIIRACHQQPFRQMAVNGKKYVGDERELFNQTISQHGFKEALDLNLPTWSPVKSSKWELFRLKLDWCMVKNLNIIETKLGDYVSDHRSIYVEYSLL